MIKKQAFFYQRFSHGIAFGRERSTQYSITKRLIMVGLSPAIPLLFLSKLYHSTRSNQLLRTKFRCSIFYIIYFLTGWALGEVKGYIQGATK